MFKRNLVKKFILLCLVIAASIGRAEGKTIKDLYCAPELSGVLAKIQELPEGNSLLSKVLKEGPLYIEINSDLPNQFGGYWSFFERTIYITKTNQSSDCFLISTLLFELHNAEKNSDLKEITFLASNRKMERQAYIEAIEYIEYKNAYATSLLLDQGAKKAIFPYNCHWNVSDTFQEHLRIQENHGHSAFIGKVYDELTLENQS